MSEGTDVAEPASLLDVNAFVLLGAQHVRLSATAHRLVTWEPADGGGDLAARWVRTRATILQRHEAVEDEHFWPVVGRVVPHGWRLVARADEQHGDLGRAVQRLVASPEDPEAARRAGRALLAHLAYEEERVWPALWSALGVAESAELTDAIRGAGSGL